MILGSFNRARANAKALLHAIRVVLKGHIALVATKPHLHQRRIDPATGLVRRQVS